MGTSWSAQIVGAPADVEVRLVDVLAGVIGSMSQWDSASALSRFNRSPIGAWQDLPAELVHVVNAGNAIGTRTRGAFNPAQGTLTELWGFGATGRRTDIPADAEIADALACASSSLIEFDDTRGRRVGAAQLDLSGIAKGFAVDALAQCLCDLGVADFLVEIGGEWVGRGIRPDGQPWWVELEMPPGIVLAPFRVALHNIAVATSGDYRRFIPGGGRRLGHTLDPRTGWPVDNGVVSVTVLAQDCMRADGWATALTVLGCGAGLAMADRDGLAARIVTGDGREHFSTALLAMLD